MTRFSPFLSRQFCSPPFYFRSQIRRQRNASLSQASPLPRGFIRQRDARDHRVYVVDRGTLENVPIPSPVRMPGVNAFASVYGDASRTHSATEFRRMSQAGKVDYVLFRSYPNVSYANWTSKKSNSRTEAADSRSRPAIVSWKRRGAHGTN